MKAIIDIPRKMLNLAEHLFIAKYDDPDTEEAVRGVVQSLHDATIPINKPKLEGWDDVTLGLALFAIADKMAQKAKGKAGKK